MNELKDVKHMGKRAGFESDTMRVPVGLIPLFKEIISDYKNHGMTAAEQRLNEVLESIKAA